MTYIRVSKLNIIGLDNAEILLIGPFRTHVSEILIKSYSFSFKKM